ncbi:MAG TPA: ABC transporter permease subunit [Bacillota bacterium]|nr:ABC transporter permease subunit [Peptococcaceae bacterium MAG4]HPU35209.1 ABC transporter permease subunit [Bacillota bacterium]HPZ43494.1 ABC transporter permease subunit [Bacillota bacterium]HQD76013.1 ABC transporter permease subunit [Bacillota bacterium]HUM58669.1 ABC transporter permease subunit [Bacillota bacterium]
MDRHRRLVAFDYFLAVVVLLVLWEILSYCLNESFFPGPLESFITFARELGDKLGMNLLVSTARVIASLLVALLPAVLLGMVLGRVERLDRYAAPLIYLTYPVPKIIFLPVVLTLLGLGDVSKIFLISIIVFFQILVTTRDAARQVNKGMVDSVISLGAGELQIYRSVIYPACLPKILTSLRISLGTAIAVLFFSETIANRGGYGGIGYYVMDAWARLAWDEMFAGIIAMGAMGFILYLILDWLEKRLCPWEFLK